MPFYVGYYNGFAKIYDIRTKKTKELDFGRDARGIMSHIDAIAKKAPLAEVRLLLVQDSVEKESLFTTSFWSTKPTIYTVSEVQDKGFQQVQVNNYGSITLQAIVNEKRLSFIEGEYFLYFWGDVTTLWQHLDGKLYFERKLPKENDANFLLEVRKAIYKKEVQKRIYVNAHYSTKNHLLLDCKNEIIDRNSNFEDSKVADTALWMAKRNNRLEWGYLVQNCGLSGPKVMFDKKCVFDKENEGVPLPFAWTSDWDVKAKTAIVSIGGLTADIQLPKNKAVRVLLKVDLNGEPHLNFEVRTVIGISLRFDSLFIANTHDAGAEMTVLGPIDTDVNFEKNPQEATISTPNEIVIKNSIEMLDCSLELKEGWIRCDSKNVIFVDPHELVSASRVVERLLRYVLKLTKTEGLLKVVLTVPTEFTKNQRLGLKETAERICDKVVLLPEDEAFLFGIAEKNNLVDGNLLLTVDLSMNGCTCTLAKVVPGPKINQLAKKTDVILCSEDVRQNQRWWIQRMQETAYPPTHTPELEAEVDLLQNTTYIVDSVEETYLNQLRQLTDFVMKNENVSNVRIILLLGDCRMIPLLNNLLCWKFSNARIITPSNADVQKLAAVGAASAFIYE